ncbi:GntR family transcriptional regulator [Devosia nitrariae]|uniref:GntR family transcriptional regulator n=1 Tax=Devosia nitrariae TaxID=2071872 RepID=A0ABQ5VZW8_9HYPH|nr:GntR family transcriptional regulator [Devosia nitrariae]GLQ53360.1 GntR family transcriptional regulator [Devosia nitrariae]
MNAPRHQTLRERIYSEIVRLIVSGELPSGAPIDERAMISRLDVSRTPFREAIGTLAKEGLVEIKPYRGFYVRSFTPGEISDLYELRKTLECFATRLAVPRMTDADIVTFERILNEAVEALRERDMEVYAERDREFHQLVATTSENAALVETLARLDLQIQICRLIANESRDLAERAAEERDQILSAFRNKDAERAAELMFDHISDVQAAVMERFSQVEPR